MRASALRCSSAMRLSNASVSLHRSMLKTSCGPGPSAAESRALPSGWRSRSRAPRPSGGSSATCSALLLASLPRPIKSESSRPTRTLPPIIAACVAKRHLVPPGGQHRPRIIVAEQLVGGALHEHQIVDVGADAAEDAEDQLQEDRRLEPAFVDAMGEIVEVADVVAFVLELGAVALAEQLVDPLDVVERVAEDGVVGAAQIGLLPVVFPVLVAVAPGIERRNSSSPC